MSDDDLLTFAGGHAGRSRAGGGVAPRRGPRTIRYVGETGTVMDIDDSGEVAMKRWHRAKGRAVTHLGDGACRMLLVDRQAWMDYAPTEPEGSILCPGCNCKLGAYNLGGLNCSCGLHVAPAYKFPKARLDATLVGVDILEARMAGVDLTSRGALADVVEEGSDEDGDDDGDASSSDGDGDDGSDGSSSDADARGKRMRVPVSKHRGNFRYVSVWRARRLGVGRFRGGCTVSLSPSHPRTHPTAASSVTRSPRRPWYLFAYAP